MDVALPEFSLVLPQRGTLDKAKTLEEEGIVRPSMFIIEVTTATTLDEDESSTEDDGVDQQSDEAQAQ